MVFITYYNIIVKIKKIIYSLTIAPPPPNKKLWVRTWIRYRYLRSLFFPQYSYIHCRSELVRGHHKLTELYLGHVSGCEARGEVRYTGVCNNARLVSLGCVGGPAVTLAQEQNSAPLMQVNKACLIC
jgi:hypothetical protein